MERVIDTPLFMIRLGRSWFQWRGFSPLPLFALCLLLSADFSLSPPALAVVGVGIVLTEVVRIWAVGYAGSITRTRSDSVGSLVHAGPFRYVRNPLYLANIAMYTLFGIAFGFLWLSVIIALYFTLQYSFIIAFEEDTLSREYGVAYRYYCARVPRWFPVLRHAIESSAHSFCLRQALRSERATFVALFCMSILAVLKQTGFL